MLIRQEMITRVKHQQEQKQIIIALLSAVNPTVGVSQLI